MNIYIVRHGQTSHNKSKCYYGSLDVELTDVGIGQAERACEFLQDVNFDKVFISDKTRTKKTAEIILKDKNGNIKIDKRINETDFGLFEGKTYEELEKNYPNEWQDWCNDWKNCCPPEGESYTEVYNRVKSFMDDILKLDCENLLIVTHSGVIRSIYTYILLGNLDLFWKFSSQNGDISIIKYEYGNLYIDSITHI